MTVTVAVAASLCLETAYCFRITAFYNLIFSGLLGATLADWAHLFVGRERELAALKHAFVEASGGQTRVVALVAESGFGKTRLVQEFYGWLSTHHDGVGSQGYWPDRLLKREDNLLINPDASDAGRNSASMPFLWWGLRLHDPDARNEIVSRALWAGSDILKAHLERYVLAIQTVALRRKSEAAMTSGAVDLAIEAAGNLLSFGLLGTGKTLLQTGKELFDLDRERRRVAQLDNSPAASDQRACDELTLTLIGDLARLAKSPPAGFAPIPVVLVLDDAQWLSHDEATSAFANSLIAQARAEAWPLLIILTSWEREWRDSGRAASLPASLLNTELGDKIILLPRAPELGEVVETAFPGLNLEQRNAILDQVDGNPRFLDEVLKYLNRNPKHFEGRDPSGSLTPRGLEEVARRAFPDFVADRFAEAPGHVRRTMSLASVQGTSFSPRIVRTMAEQLTLEGASEGLAEGEDPHGFTSSESLKGESEFRLRAYRNAAWDDLGNHASEDAALEALEVARAEVMLDPESASERDLQMVLEGGDEKAKIHASAVLILRAAERQDLRAAGVLAENILPLARKHLDWCDADHLLSIVWAHQIWAGPTRAVADTLEYLVDGARQELDQTPSIECRETLLLLLNHLAEAVQALGGHAAARRLREEIVSIARGLNRDSMGLSNLGGALVSLGHTVEMLDGPAAALPLYENAESLFRQTMEEDPSIGHRRDLGLALGGRANAIESLSGPGAARKLRLEVVELTETLANEHPSLVSLHDYAFALQLLGYTDLLFEGASVAKPRLELSVNILRKLYEEHGNRAVRQILSNSLSILALTIEEEDGPADAESVFIEAVSLCRDAFKEQPLQDTKTLLAVLLSRLGNTIERLGRHDDVKTIRQEVVSLSRELADSFPTTSARRDLAAALGSLSNTMVALEGHASARGLLEEELGITRSLAQEDATPEALRNLAATLSRLAVAVKVVEGVEAARPLLVEAAHLGRAFATPMAAPSNRREAAVHIHRLANVTETIDGPAAARPLREECAAMCRELVRERSLPDAQRDLIGVLEALVTTLEALKDHQAALLIRTEIDGLHR